MGHVALIRETRGLYRILVGNPREIYHLEEQGVDGKIILKFVFKKLDGSIDWIELTRNRGGLRAVVNM